MLQINPKKIEEYVHTNFDKTCTVFETDAPETRFTFRLEFEDFCIDLYASEARICLNLPINSFSCELKKALLLQFSLILEDVSTGLVPYKLSLWSNDNKTYTKTPSLGTMQSNPDFMADICTGPCDVSTTENALPILYDLLKKSLQWLFSLSADVGEEEGERRDYNLSKVERSQKNRALCIAIHGYVCGVCDEKLTDKYGEIAEKFIHVHHLECIAHGGKKWINPEKDLITVCPNCHSMLHRREPPLLPEELRKIILKTKGSRHE